MQDSVYSYVGTVCSAVQYVQLCRYTVQCSVYSYVGTLLCSTVCTVM